MATVPSNYKIVPPGLPRVVRKALAEHMPEWEMNTYCLDCGQWTKCGTTPVDCELWPDGVTQ